jgi:hypothetical protein
VTAALMNEQVKDNGLLTAPAIMTTAGDIIYASDANTPARLAKSTTSTQYLANTGTSNVPQWNEVALATGVSGTLPVGNGGTGITSLGSNVATFLGTPSSANLRSALTDETGTGAAVFATSPTLVTPALGTPSALVATNATGTAANLTAGTVTANANLTGVVTSSGNATAIADKAIGFAKLADGTDGELITWNASGVIAAVAVGSDGQVLTSGGAGVAPTFEAAGGVLASTTLVGARTASAGAGTQSITGAGFDPTAAIIFGADKGSAYASWGIVDDANDADNLRHGGSTPSYDQVGGRPGIEITDGSNDLQGTVTLISDGVQIVWTKNGSGLDTDFTILCLR